MDIERIKANPNTIYGIGKNKVKLRVAAYCRVSTDNEDQMNSYNSQKEYYYKLITENPDYDFVGIYADPGISGTTAEKRDEFKRLIADAKEGKIDIIMTKSISRFARNTLDTLKYVRELKLHNVSVQFEEERINTLSMDGELLLTILSSVAQQEVQNTSDHVKKGLQMKMQRGELIGFNQCLGYDYDKSTKSIKVNPEEAKIVKYIFQRYLDGYGAKVIGRELTDLGYKTKLGKNRWSDSVILNILKNVKYKGDLVQGITYTTDPLTKKRIKNRGHSDMFYVKNHHEAIIDEETFEKVQQINRTKHEYYASKIPDEDGNIQEYKAYKRQFAFSSIAYCACCGSRLFRRQVDSGKKTQKFIWQCANHVRNGSITCPNSRAVDEKMLEKAFVEAFNKMAKTKLDDIDDFLVDINKGLTDKDYSNEINKIQNDINKIEKKKSNLLDMRMDDLISKDDFTVKINVLNVELNKLREEESKYSKLSSSKINFREKINDFKKVLKESDVLTEFDKTIFDASVERVIVGSDNDPLAVSIVFKMEYTDGERVFNNVNNSNNKINCETAFITMTDEERKHAFEHMYKNTNNLFSFDCAYTHFVFLPTSTGARNKILKNSFPVNVLILDE